MKPGSTVTLFAGVFLASLSYAVARYAVFKGVAVVHLPLYVLNKAVAVTALVMLASALVVRDADARLVAGRAGFGLAGLHVLLTLPIVTPGYFPTLFTRTSESASMLTAQGEIALLLGAVAAVLWTAPGWDGSNTTSSSPALRFEALRIGAMAAVGLHAAVLGWPSWWSPSTWPGRLPPITLWCSFIAFVGVVASIVRKRHQGS